MAHQPLELSCCEAQRRLSEDRNSLLIDCRESEEHQLVAISGSKLLPMSQLPERLPELTGRESESLIVYCHHGLRSAHVAAWLREQGFSQAVSMAGGIDAWALEIEPGMVRY